MELRSLKSHLIISTIALGVSSVSTQAAAISYEFNTLGSTEGWNGANSTGFGQTTGIDGTSGVLTADSVGNDPNVNTGTIPLTAGETWSDFSARLRHLNVNPMAPIAAVPFAGSGTLLFFNNTTQIIVGDFTTAATVTGTGAYAGDTFNVSLIPDPSGDEWQLFTVDFSSAPTFNSQNINGVRFDILGNDIDKIYEIDYIRLTSVPLTSIPEPSSLTFSALVVLTGLARRRRR